MKKGYIFSWYNYGRNYGQTLQAYALQKVLNNEGYKVAHICFGINRTVTQPFIIKLLDYLKLTNIERVVQDKFDLFISENMKVTKKLWTNKQVKKFIKKKNPDFLICGSDQIWNPYNVHPFYYLAQIGDEKTNRIAYAVSTCDKRRKEKFLEFPQIEKWIKKINYLYVRENTGKEIYSELFGIESEVVLDPTLLLSGEEWISNLKLKTNNQNYILCYAFNLTNDQEKMLKNIAQENECEIKYGNILEKEQIYKEQWSPTDFLEAILNAKKIFTDSFHGTAFSILFHKDFIVFDNGSDLQSDPYYNIDRMNTLLTLLELEERVINNNEEYSNKTIDYQRVDQILNKRRNECISLLQRSIG